MHAGEGSKIWEQLRVLMGKYEAYGFWVLGIVWIKEDIRR